MTTYPNLSTKQQKILAIVPKCTSALSIVGCLYVVCSTILGRVRTTQQNDRTWTNLLIGLCSADLITSVAFFLSTWPAPKGTWEGDNFWGERGNQTTCNIQGFMIQLGSLSSVMYTSGITLHFLLGIRCLWLPSQVKKIDPFLHVACILLPLATAVLGWIKSLYNPGAASILCYIYPYPDFCGDPGQPKCIRGEHAKLYFFSMMVLPILLAFTFIFIAMILIYLTVSNQERRVSTYFVNIDMARQTFYVACQYVAAFSFAYLPIFISFLVKSITRKPDNFYFALVRAFCTPMQGFLNALIYSHDLRQRLKSIQRSLSNSLRTLITTGKNRDREVEESKGNQIGSN